MENLQCYGSFYKSLRFFYIILYIKKNEKNGWFVIFIEHLLGLRQSVFGFWFYRTRFGDSEGLGGEHWLSVHGYENIFGSGMKFGDFDETVLQWVSEVNTNI